MLKKITKKPFLFLSILVIFASFILAAFPQQKIQAATTNNILKQVGLYCHDLEDTVDVVGPKNAEITCSSAENDLQGALDCPDLFYTHAFPDDPHDSSITKTLWFTKEGAYKTCYNNALAQYNALAGTKCKQMRRDRDNWNECEDIQSNLYFSLGCNDHMFKDLNNGYWGYDDTKLNDCKRRLDDVGNIHIMIIVNNQVVKSPNAIKNGAVQSEEDANAAGDSEGTSSCGGGINLGWIICGITEVVQNFGEWVFQDYIQPMMENNPVSAKPGDPFYQAWQGFRFLANILLIGSLLAIVYSQTRGGGS